MDHLGIFKPWPFPSAYFYAFLGRGAVLCEKYHHGLSLSSFPSFSSIKYFQENLVSFMLIKVSEWPSSQYRFNLFWPNWTTNDKEVSHPLQDAWALVCIPLFFFGYRRLPTKGAPTGVFFVLSYSLKLKAPLSIYFLELAKNPWDCTTTVSLDTTPHKTVW